MQRLASEKSIMLNEGDNFSLLSDEYKFQIEVFAEENEMGAEVVERAESIPATVISSSDLPHFTNYESDASVKDNLSDSSYYNTSLKRKSSSESSAKKIKTHLNDAAVISEAILAETVAAGLDLAEKDNWGSEENNEMVEKDLASENSAQSTDNENQRATDSKEPDEPQSVSEGEVD